MRSIRDAWWPTLFLLHGENQKPLIKAEFLFLKFIIHAFILFKLFIFSNALAFFDSSTSRDKCLRAEQLQASDCNNMLSSRGLVLLTLEPHADLLVTASAGSFIGSERTGSG